MASLLVAILVLSPFISLNVEGACKAHDAAWERNTKPTITQPSRAHPEKVLLDWSRAIYNARCVDFYNIYIWKRGQTRERGQKIVISDKTQSKAELVIDPCIEYNFAIEFVEKDWTHTDQEISQTIRFKTEAIPSFVNKDPKNFVVTYATDPIKRHQVVDKVSIKFRKDVIKHASCIKHVKIEGQIDNSIGGSSQTRGRGRAMGFGQRVVGGSSQNGGSWSGQQSVGGSSQSGGSWNQVGGSSQQGGSVGGSSQQGGSWNQGGNWNVGGSSQQGGSVGGSSQQGGNWNVGGSSQQGGSVGGSSQAGGYYQNPDQSWSWNYGGNMVLPDNYGQYRNPNCPVGGSSQSHSGNYDPRCYWARPDYDHDHVHGDHQTLSRPPYNNNNQGGIDWNSNNNNLNWNRRNKRSHVSKPPHGNLKRVNFELEPPFIDQYIEAVFPISPCQGYKFDLKIVSPRNAVLGEVKDLKLTKLSETYEFHPPQLNDIIQISSTGSMTLKPSSGIPSTCLKDFFEAVDNHMSFMEEDLLFHMNQEHRAHQNTREWADRLTHHKVQQLISDGCQCNTTWLKVNGTSKSAYSYLMGDYHFEGMFQGKPYFRHQKRDSTVQGFLYWDSAHNSWNIGPTLGGNDMKLKTSQFGNAKCPADVGNLKNWQYSGTLKWKKDSTLKIECLYHLSMPLHH